MLFIRQIALLLHNKSCLTERKATHFTKFETVAKSLPCYLKKDSQAVYF